jgi:hypothetical protein
LHGRTKVTKSGAIISAQDLNAYCPDLEEWPERWQGDERDLPPGQQIVELFKPFLIHLLSLNLSSKTLRKHRDNLWLLGGELIRDLQMRPKLRKQPIATYLLSVIGNDEGPLLYDCDSEADQRAFDSTCRKLHRFLSDANNNPR